MINPPPQRKSHRLPNYDYAQAGAFAVTLCVQNRYCLFGEIRGDHVVLNDAGKMIEKWWFELEHKFGDAQVDTYVVMPNHFHGIFVTGCGPNIVEHPSSLEAVMDWFKTMTTNAYIRGVKESGWPTFHKHLWQRSCYDHIIRSEFDLGASRLYIANNPAQWSSDSENPDPTA